MNKIIEIVLIVAGTVIVLSVLMALPVMLLWNVLMPEIFGLVKISFWQALGICLLSSMLFKSSSSSKD